MQKSLCAYVLLIIACLIPTVSNWYFLWLKSWDNTASNIKRVEKEIGIELPVVSFIFDPRDDMAYNTVASLPTELWRQKIYHITVSPQNTAKEVAEGQADGMYKAFFELIRDIHIKVVFRTMHEMNGGRYPRSSDPANFAKARQRIWKISREVWLSKEEILFDMSVNGWDIPTRDAVPHQWSLLFFCFPWQKHKLNCPTFEDYYPWDDYVDIMWFTFYNRWKGNANRLWQAPYEIIDHPQRRTLTRLKRFDKPLFIDEVGTTAVRYNEKYSQQKSKEVFQTESWRKNAWLDSLSSFLDKEDRIVWSIYFNIDLTYGLEHRQQWEADRSIFDPATNKIYEWWKRLFENASDNNIMSTPLYDVFGIRRMMWWKEMIWISKKYGKQALALLKDLGVNDTTPYGWGKVALESYEKKIKASKLSKTQQTSRQYIINEAKKIIAQ